MNITVRYHEDNHVGECEGPCVVCDNGYYNAIPVSPLLREPHETYLEACERLGYNREGEVS